MDKHEGHHNGHHGLGHMGSGMGMGFGARRGEFRFLILMALSQKPMHGYALIQDIGRTYQRPVSPGIVYPALHEHEDMGFVVVEEKDGKKVYSITKEGEDYLKENEEVVDRLKAGQEYAGKVGQFNFMRDIRDIQAMIMMNADYVDKGKMEKIEAILTEAKRKVATIVYQ